MLEAERGDVEGDAGVEALVAPVEPLPQDRPQAPLGELVDQAVLLGQRNEARRLDRPELRIVPADQRLDPDQAAVAQRHLGLVDHVQPLLVERAAEARRAIALALPAHGTSVALSSVKHRLELFEAHRLFDRAGHVEAERLAEPEGGFEHSAVEAADDQHRRAIILVGEEAEQLDPVHARHSKVERDHVGPVGEEGVAKLVVVAR